MIVALSVMGYGFRGGEGRINRAEASLLLVALVAYNGWLLNAVLTVWSNRSQTGAVFGGTKPWKGGAV